MVDEGICDLQNAANGKAKYLDVMCRPAKSISNVTDLAISKAILATDL
jgi:hypothetical protein